MHDIGTKSAPVDKPVTQPPAVPPSPTKTGDIGARASRQSMVQRAPVWFRTKPDLRVLCGA